MKICYIFSGIYQAKIIGQSAVALRLIEHTDKKKNTQVFMISNYLLESDYFYINGENKLLLKGPNILRVYLKNTSKILTYLKKIKPDILHVRGLLMVIYVWVLNKLFLRYPLVISIFETPEHLKSFYRRLISFCINRAEITFVSSYFIKEQFVENGALPDKILVRHTGLKEKFLKVNETNSPFNTDVIFFGDSTKERGFDIIYKLAKKLKKIKFKVLLRWQGENCRDEYEQIKKFKNVTVWHYPYAESLEKILLKTKLIVLPYRYMGMRPPISLLESMALGKCVISSDMRGNEELIKHGENGFIYNFSDLEIVSEKINFLLDNDDVRNSISLKAKKTIKEQYSLVEYDKIYNYYSYVKENFYERRMFGSIGSRYISEKETSLVVEMLNPGKEIILDVGTGSGRFAREIIKSSGASITGIDPDKKILEEGKILQKIFLTKEENKRYKCILGDGHNLPFADNQFNKVFSFRVLKYYKNPWKGISELIRVLKPGGELVLEITSNLSWESLINPLLSKTNYNKKILHFWEDSMINFNPNNVKKYILDKKMILLDEIALHKIPPALFTLFNQQFMNKLLDLMDRILLKSTHKYLFSKSIVLKFKKVTFSEKTY